MGSDQQMARSRDRHIARLEDELEGAKCRAIDAECRANAAEDALMSLEASLTAAEARVGALEDALRAAGDMARRRHGPLVSGVLQHTLAEIETITRYHLPAPQGGDDT